MSLLRPENVHVYEALACVFYKFISKQWLFFNTKSNAISLLLYTYKLC